MVAVSRLEKIGRDMGPFYRGVSSRRSERARVPADSIFRSDRDCWNRRPVVFEMGARRKITHRAGSANPSLPVAIISPAVVLLNGGSRALRTMGRPTADENLSFLGAPPPTRGHSRL